MEDSVAAEGVGVDQTNYRKSIDQVLALLQVLDCEVDLVVRARTA